MQRLMRAMHKNEKGFTLVELMVVVVIIGILVAIAIPIYNAVQANAQERACYANQRTLEGLASMYMAEEDVWPGSVADLIAEGLIADEPSCPFTDANYTFTTGTGTIVDCGEHGHYSD